MIEIKEIKAKIAAKENLEQVFEETFMNCYSCIRVWSAWGYNTMSHDDFFHFEKGDEVYEESLEHLKRKINLIDCSNIDSFIHVIEKIMENYSLFYNHDIDNNFDSVYFYEDILSCVSLENLHMAVIEYQQTHLSDIII